MAELDQVPTPEDAAPAGNAASPSPGPPAPHRPPRAPKPAAKAEAEPDGAGSGMTVFLVGLAIFAIVALYALAKAQLRDQGPRELPIISCLVEVDSFDPETRQSLVNFQHALEATGLFDVYGPASEKYLVPPEKKLGKPGVRELSSMSQAEWDKAWPYFICGDWLVPRLFRLDGKACVVRIAPKKGARTFAPDAAAVVDRIVHDGGIHHLKTVKVYSASAGIGGPAERDALNVTFGATTAWAIISRPATSTDPGVSWRTPDGMKLLEKASPNLEVNKTIRAVTTPVSWFKYYFCVRSWLPKDPEIPMAQAPIDEAFDFARAAGVNALLTQDGAKALVDVTTSAEGRENAELYYYLASTLQEQLRVKVEGRVPKLDVGGPDRKP